jgi:hypothetical protein
MPPKAKPTDPGQGERFIEAARKSGANESGKSFDRVFKKIVPVKKLRRKRPNQAI